MTQNPSVKDSAPSPSRRWAIAMMVVGAIGFGVGFVKPVFAAPSGAPSVDVELVVLHGTKGPKDEIPAGFDELKNAPWSVYNHYEILSTKTLVLVKDVAVKETLPDGATVEATLLETAPKLKFEVSVTTAKGVALSKAKYTAPKGARFMPATVPYKGGSMVISLKVI